MVNDINELFESEHYIGENTNVIKKIIDKFNVEYLSKPDSDIKNYYEDANKIAREITDSYCIKSKNSNFSNAVYFNSFMNAVSETFLLAWLLSFNPEKDAPNQEYDYDQEFDNNSDVKTIAQKRPSWASWPSWPSYNKKSLQMCFCNLYNYIENSNDLINFKKNGENQTSLQKFDEDFNKKPTTTSIVSADKFKVPGSSSDSASTTAYTTNTSWGYVSFEQLKKLRNRFSHGTIVNPGDKDYEVRPEINVFKYMRGQIKFSVLFLEKKFFEEI